MTTRKAECAEGGKAGGSRPGEVTSGRANASLLGLAQAVSLIWCSLFLLSVSVSRLGCTMVE
jgi:hypothetical protein